MLTDVKEETGENKATKEELKENTNEDCYNNNELGDISNRIKRNKTLSQTNIKV